MSDCSGGRIKKRVTIIASVEGLEKAEKALVKFKSKTIFAQCAEISRSSVTNFFGRKPIEIETFEIICKELILEWQDIAGIAEESANAESKEKQTNLSSSAEVGVEPVTTLVRQITVSDESSQKIKAEIKLKGDIDSVENIQFIASILRRYGGSTIKIIDIQEGSIKLIVEGSQEDIDRLLTKIELGELTEIDSFPIESTQILIDSTLLCRLIKKALHSTEQAEVLALMIDQIPEIKGYLGKNWLPYYEQALPLTMKDVQQNISRFPQKYRLNLETLDYQNNSETARVKQQFISWVVMILKRDCYDIRRRSTPHIYSLDEIIGEGNSTRGDVFAGQILSGVDTLLEAEERIIYSRLKKYIETDPHEMLRNCHVRDRPEVNCQALLQLKFLEKSPLTLQEISEKLQVPVQTIENRLKRNCMPLIKHIISEFLEK